MRCLQLHVGRRPTLFFVVSDALHSGLFQVLAPCGALSHSVNLSRAKDAAIVRYGRTLRDGKGLSPRLRCRFRNADVSELPMSPAMRVLLRRYGVGRTGAAIVRKSVAA